MQTSSQTKVGRKKEANRVQFSVEAHSTGATPHDPSDWPLEPGSKSIHLGGALDSQAQVLPVVFACARILGLKSFLSMVPNEAEESLGPSWQAGSRASSR